DSVELKSPVDCVVLKLWLDVGQVPYDEGIGVFQIADKSAYRFVVQVPGEVQRNAMVMGTKYAVELEADVGTVSGTVVEFLGPVGEDVPVVLALDPHEGIAERLHGTV